MYPALAVLQAVVQEDSDTYGRSAYEDHFHSKDSTPSALEELLWVGGINGMEEDLVKRAGITYEAIPAAGVHGVGLRALPGNMWKLFQGFLASMRLLRNFHPDVLFFTGGYVAVPMALAGRMPIGTARPKNMLYVPDIEPGLALKTLARFADRIAVTSRESEIYFTGGKQVEVTGYPTRVDLQRWNRDEARKILGVSVDLPTMLVLGGSKGARSINRALLGALPHLIGDLQVIHITGELDWSEVENARKDLANLVKPELLERYRIYPYLHHEMGAVLTIADFVLSRAGASALGEYPLFGLPAILVPYPHAWRYQQVNAAYLAQQEAAIVIQDEDLHERLVPVVNEIINNPHRLEKMSSAMSSLANPYAAKKIANQMFELASGRGGTR